MTGSARIVRGDARHLPLADNSIDLVVTSPPYFGLRSYQDGGQHYDGQIGDEATPAEFIAALLDVTAECMRVLKPSGSMFVNLGDRYSTGSSGDRNNGFNERSGNAPGKRAQERSQVRAAPAAGLPPKTLLLIPEMYRIACVYDLGLIARAVIVWDKPNGLPESVTDRVRRSHEDWVHLTKQPRYYSAVDEIREAHVAPGRLNGSQRQSIEFMHAAGDVHRGLHESSHNPLGKLPGSVWEIPTQPLRVPPELGVDHFAAFPMEWPRRLIRGWSPPGICTECGEGRRPVVASVALNMDRPQARRAHELATAAGLTEEHFQALLSVGVSDTGRGAATQSGTGKNTPEVYALAAVARKALGGYAREYLLRRPSGFTYACACPEPSAPTRPAVILDPFGGTGTTALVARALGRHGISVDMSADYCRLAEWRTNDPGELARAMQVEKPPAQLDGQLGMFEETA